MKRIYLSGPLRRDAASNYAAFDYATAVLSARGFDLVSPVDLMRARGHDGTEQSFTRDERCTFITHRLLQLADCDAVLLIDGWEHCAESAVEIADAKYLGIPVFQHPSQLPAIRKVA